MSVYSLKTMSKENLVDGMDIGGEPTLSFCEGCVYGKQHRNPFPTDGGLRAKKVLELIHSDLCGPMQTTSFGGAKYFLTFIDDFSRKTFVYIL